MLKIFCVKNREFHKYFFVFVHLIVYRFSIRVSVLGVTIELSNRNVACIHDLVNGKGELQHHSKCINLAKCIQDSSRVD